MSASPLSSSIPLVYFRADGDMTYKQLICLTDWNVDTSHDTSTKNTLHCGPITSTSDEKFTGTFGGIFDTDVDPALEITSTDLKTWSRNNTKLNFRIADPTPGSIGSIFYLEGDCKITNFSYSATAEDDIAFTANITGEGFLEHEPS